MRLRQFNEEGVKAFHTFLTTCRETPDSPVPWGLLEDARYSAEVVPAVNVERRGFADRAEAASYLSNALAGVPESILLENRGLWTWLTLLYIDSVCPANAGRRNVRSIEFYVFYPKDSLRAYYHLLYVPWRIVRMAPEYCRLFLTGPVSQQNEVTRLVMKRLYLLRIPCIFETLDRLYWDATTNRPRRGIVSKDRVEPGDLRNRFPIRVRQLERTYDLVSLSADQLLELLGEEFRR